MRKLTLGAIALAASTVIASTASHAALLISGSVWTNVPANASNATLTPPPGAPQVTFTANEINYTSGPVFSISEFLNSAANGVVITSGGATATAAGSLTNTYFLLNGTTGLPNTAFNGVVTHDDGVTLDIAGIPGIEVSSPGPTSTINSNFVVPAGNGGNHTFQLAYGECCGAPARLSTNLPEAAVPEPASLALLGTALVGLVPVLRRRRKTS